MTSGSVLLKSALLVSGIVRIVLQRSKSVVVDRYLIGIGIGIGRVYKTALVYSRRSAPLTRTASKVDLTSKPAVAVHPKFTDLRWHRRSQWNPILIF